MFSAFSKKDSPLITGSSTSLAPVVLDWEARLEAARVSDEALLALLAENPPIEVKLAAVQALRGEEALRLAEREFRTHDRRVHTVAKQAYERSVTQRKMRARADELIAEATAVSGELMIPANRLVDLDQAWRTLDTALLHPDQRTKFVELQDALVKHVRDLGERQREISRWCADARKTLTAIAEAHAQLSDTACGLPELRSALGHVAADAKSRLDQIGALLPVVGPDARNASMLAGQLTVALNDASLIAARLEILLEIEKTISSIRPSDQSNVKAIDKAVQARWESVAEISVPSVAEALAARFAAFIQSGDEARREAIEAKRQRTHEKRDAAHQLQMQALGELIAVTNTALADGRVSEAIKQLPALQSALDRGNAAAELQQQLGALHSELLVLKQWQHWGGGQVRADLVEEAETLARSVVSAEQKQSTKTPVAQLEKYIEQLRGRWKELDRLGGATGKPMWQRFDTALKSAEAPIAAHKARLAEARVANLAAREGLLATLEALIVASDDSGHSPDWKANAAALSRFQTEWRKLGPLEHTVPHKKLAALTKRMRNSVSRVETPLKARISAAITEREAIVARANLLGARAQDRDLMNRLRDLQSQWQAHSKSMPLPQPVERKLWAAFKTATDAVMNQRHAASNARDAEFKVAQQAREALIVRLKAIGPDTPSVEIKRVVTEVNGAWRECGDPGKDKSAKLEARFREALDLARQHLAGSARRKWLATCDGLMAKLLLCDVLDANEPIAETEILAIEARWASLAAQSSPWDVVLQSRYERGIAQHRQATPAVANPKHAKSETLDDVLLKLELELGIASPASAEGARRALKLLAMKNALEGNKSTVPAPANFSKLTADAFGWRWTNADQKRRLEAVVAALRLADPDRLQK